MLQLAASVTVVGRDAERLEKVSARLGDAVQTAPVDALDRSVVDGFLAERALPVDHLVLSFSTGRPGGPLRDLSMAGLRPP